MHHTLDKILGKPSDYKLCESCGNVTWYENSECAFCGDEGIQDAALMNEKEMGEWMDEEIKYWRDEEGYDEEEIWSIEKEV